MSAIGGTSGLVLFNLSFSHFDPKRSSTQLGSCCSATLRLANLTAPSACRFRGRQAGLRRLQLARRHTRRGAQRKGGRSNIAVYFFRSGCDVACKNALRIRSPNFCASMSAVVSMVNCSKADSTGPILQLSTGNIRITFEGRYLAIQTYRAFL